MTPGRNPHTEMPGQKSTAGSTCPLATERCWPLLHTLLVAVLTGMLLMACHPGLLDSTLGHRPGWFGTLVKYREWLLWPYLVLTLNWILNVSRNKPGY